MAEPTLKDAAALIERMKTIRPTCAFCAQESYDWYKLRTAESQQRMLAVGWEQEPHQASYVLRCYPCRDTVKYPWAAKLDAERVLAHMKTKDSVWCLDELEAFV